MDYSATPRPAGANSLDPLDALDAQGRANLAGASATTSATASAAAEPGTQPVKRLHQAKAIAAITLGNGLEFFDFTIYSFFATIIGKLYFPVEGQLAQLMLAVGTFGVGFIMRPVGGVVLGGYADRAGRKAAMSLTLWLMTLGSAIIAFAPTYAAIGVAAPLLVILARLIQGFALGGEIGASTSLLLEYGSDKTRGFYGSWQFVSQGLNTVCGSLLGVALAATLSQTALESWGWRVPFVIGMAMGPIGIYIRRHLDETLPGVEDAAQVAAKPASQPVRDLFRDHARSITTGVLTTIGGTAANYIVLFYLSTYAIRILHLPMVSALWAAWTGAVVTVICSPFAGTLSDRIGRKRVLWVSRVLLILAVYPAFMAINASPTVPVLLSVVAVLAVLVTFTAVPNIVMLPELFPRAIRATGMSIVYCLGVSIFGGFAQFFATWLIQISGSNLAPAWYLIGCSLVSLLPLPFMRETAGRAID
ncbi:MFS transporter [Paraburkholderia susongensis]|uniref:Predicted arabinose efflux permease, MFS family n=1 Tax=Paraburkholderia susongensis TaxID=1515439 RepID=A0A1X7JJ89_9BURK|nr:MFS transporter [Paraburkholderia susongensis]SMG28161.1 Predicted arabinose efflux permease, MFS family [Paraburkholderia susongensis]